MLAHGAARSLSAYANTVAARTCASTPNEKCQLRRQSIRMQNEWAADAKQRLESGVDEHALNSCAALAYTVEFDGVLTQRVSAPTTRLS